MPLVKICGITNVKDAVFTAELKADFIGLNLWPRSPRSIGYDEAVHVARELADCETKIVLVFVSPTKDELDAAIEKIRPSFIQIHGEWTGTLEIDGIPIMRAFGLGEPSDIEAINLWQGNPILIDAKVAGLFGGTGSRVNTDLLADVDRPYFLAGGLTPENVGEIVKRINPYGVDVASGVESSIGRKDHRAIEQFISSARINAPDTFLRPIDL